MNQEDMDSELNSRFDRLQSSIESVVVELRASIAREAQLREALESITRRGPIMGSTGEYREGQVEALFAVTESAKQALSQPAPPVVPLADVGEILEAAHYVCSANYGITGLDTLYRVISAFTSKYPQL